MENIRQNRYEKILICNSDHLHGKNRICIENKKTKNLKTSLDPKLNFLSSDVLQNAKFLVLWPTRFFPRRDSEIFVTFFSIFLPPFWSVFFIWSLKNQTNMNDMSRVSSKRLTKH